ncbi:MAG: NfeD family protein, partial [Planctomycetaceae bacterium]
VLVLFLGYLVMASQTFSGISASNAFDAALQGLFPIVSALVAVIVLATILNQFLPHIPWINGLILSPPGYAEHGDGPLLDPAVTVAADRDLLLSAGDQGVSMTTLRPSGKASFGDQYLDVVSDGPYIDSGCAVEVVRLQGRKVVVRRSAAEEPA